MTDSFEKLRKIVFSELEKQKARPAAGQSAVRLGVFLDECLANMGLSRTEFARQLGVEHELADAILDGLLPESEIGDELLVEIAGVVKYEPDLFRVMLGRSIEPARRGEDVKMRRREDG
jgi:plasmid maintenance system antidote protein VapI